MDWTDQANGRVKSTESDQKSLHIQALGLHIDGTVRAEDSLFTGDLCMIGRSTFPGRLHNRNHVMQNMLCPCLLQ